MTLKQEIQMDLLEGYELLNEMGVADIKTPDFFKNYLEKRKAGKEPVDSFIETMTGTYSVKGNLTKKTIDNFLETKPVNIDINKITNKPNADTRAGIIKNELGSITAEELFQKFQKFQKAIKDEHQNIKKVGNEIEIEPEDIENIKITANKRIEDKQNKRFKKSSNTSETDTVVSDKSDGSHSADERYKNALSSLEKYQTENKNISAILNNENTPKEKITNLLNFIKKEYYNDKEDTEFISLYKKFQYGKISNDEMNQLIEISTDILDNNIEAGKILTTTMKTGAKNKTGEDIEKKITTGNKNPVATIKNIEILKKKAAAKANITTSDINDDDEKELTREEEKKLFKKELKDYESNPENKEFTLMPGKIVVDSNGKKVSLDNYKKSQEISDNETDDTDSNKSLEDELKASRAKTKKERDTKNAELKRLHTEYTDKTAGKNAELIKNKIKSLKDDIQYIYRRMK